MTDDAPSLTPEKVREQRRIFLGVFFTVFCGTCALAYSTWGDASGHTRFVAKLAFLSIVGVGVPLMCALFVRAVRARRMGKRWGASARGWLLGAALIVAPFLGRASWQLVVWASFAAFVLAYAISMGVIFLMVSPEDEILRRREAGLD